MDKLILTLKKKWFYMIKSGEKKEEYREITDFWARRLIECKYEMDSQVLDEMVSDLKAPYDRHNGPQEVLNFFNCKLKTFNTIAFRNGYQKNAPKFEIKVNYFIINTGVEEWGAEPDKYYFTFGLGDIIGT